MRWLNIEIANLRSPAFVGAEPVERATWLSLLAYCADQENGGVIKGCREWKDRQWQMTCGVLASEVSSQAQLWEWRGRDLRIAFYPVAKEAEVQAKREFASRGGRASGEARREAQLEAQLEAGGSQDGEADLERKGKERKVMEGKEKEVGVEFPANLQSADFGAAWESYLAYRKSSRLKSLAPASIQAQLRNLSEMGHDEAIEAINQSIANGWQGIFPPKLKKPAPAKAREVDLTW
jgi:hypothetical protein